jgi:hypothetical protein
MPQVHSPDDLLCTEQFPAYLNLSSRPSGNVSTEQPDAFNFSNPASAFLDQPMLNDGTMSLNADLEDHYDYLNHIMGMQPVDTANLSYPVTTIGETNIGADGFQSMLWHTPISAAQSSQSAALNVPTSMPQRSPFSPSTHLPKPPSNQLSAPASTHLPALSSTNETKQTKPHIQTTSPVCRPSQPNKTSQNVPGDMAELLAHALRVWQSFECM